LGSAGARISTASRPAARSASPFATLKLVITPTGEFCGTLTVRKSAGKLKINVDGFGSTFVCQQF